MHIYVWGYVCAIAHMWRQPAGGSSLLQPCRFWELNTNPQLGWQVPSPPSPLTSPSLRRSILSIKPSELLNIINQFLFINRTWCCPLKMADRHNPVLKATCSMNPREPFETTDPSRSQMLTFFHSFYETLLKGVGFQNPVLAKSEGFVAFAWCSLTLPYCGIPYSPTYGIVLIRSLKYHLLYNQLASRVELHRGASMLLSCTLKD